MSKIEWTEKTWNPVTGCTKVSIGCRNCYAEGIHKWLRRMGSKKYQHDFNEVRCHPEALGKVPRAKMVFTNSMSDLFHPDVPFEFVCAVLSKCTARKTQFFQILTKRADRMFEFFEWHKKLQPMNDWRNDTNIWWGVTVENQSSFWRIQKLLECPVAVRFISVEPMLGHLDLRMSHCTEDILWRREHGGSYQRHFIDQVICGGESGPNARPMDPDWVRSLRDQCVYADIPFFFKQWGEFRAIEPNVNGGTNGYDYKRVGKKKAGRTLDGKIWSEMPNMEPSRHLNQ